MLHFHCRDSAGSTCSTCIISHDPHFFTDSMKCAPFQLGSTCVKSLLTFVFSCWSGFLDRYKSYSIDGLDSVFVIVRHSIDFISITSIAVSMRLCSGLISRLLLCGYAIEEYVTRRSGVPNDQSRCRWVRTRTAEKSRWICVIIVRYEIDWIWNGPCNKTLIEI